MKKLEFIDSVVTKYKIVKGFTEDLAAVQNEKGLWGYIDKNGNEVIPCKYINAKDFSEDLAAVQNEKGLWGYIDKNGNEVIPCKYINARNFTEELAAVQNKKGLFGYIDKFGKAVIPFMCIYADDFYNDIAIVRILNSTKEYHINKSGNLSEGHYKLSPFCNGYALVIDDNKTYTIDKKYNDVCEIKGFKYISCTTHSEIIILKNEKDLWGYYTWDLKEISPCQFEYARGFFNERAVVKKNGKVGYITPDGQVKLFDNYVGMKDFNEDLAAVRNKNGLWGYIDKNGNEVIPCTYLNVDSFSEGLSLVFTLDHVLMYIDKNNKCVLTIPNIYSSQLKVDKFSIKIEAESMLQLIDKKRNVIENVRKYLVDQANEVADDLLDSVSNQKNV